MSETLQKETPTPLPPTAAKRKRRWGDRYDGRRVRSLDPLNNIIPYVMSTRVGSTNLFHGRLDIRAAERYIRQKRTEGLKGFGMLQFFTAAYVRIISQRPGINRFVAGQKLFARHEIEVSLAVKKNLTVDGQETTVKIVCGHADTAADIHHRIMAVVGEARQTGDSNETDFAARAFAKIPGAFLKFVVWFFSKLDYFGKMPRAIHRASPFHASMFIADLGSIGLPPVHHHLYEFGNCSLFLAFGPKQKEFVMDRHGQVTEQRYFDFSLSLDERICDGFYFSGVYRMLNDIFKNPEQLDSPPERVVEDVD